MAEHQVNLSDELVAAGNFACGACRFRGDRLNFGKKFESVAGFDIIEKDGLFYFGENDLFLEFFCFADEDARGLGHCFNYEALGHNRKTGKMVVKMLFGKCHVFYGNGRLAAMKLNKLVYPNPSHKLAY